MTLINFCAALYYGSNIVKLILGHPLRPFGVPEGPQGVNHIS